MSFARELVLLRRFEPARVKHRHRSRPCQIQRPGQYASSPGPQGLLLLPRTCRF